MNRNVDPAKKNEQILSDLLKIESNKYCADCGQKGTRWASWNIGIFLCIRCGGLHRSLGTHISKVKSVTLDKWTDEQVESIKNKGNAKVNMLFNPNSDKHPFPTFSGDMENYIRDKYERKLFMIDDISIGTGRMSLNEKCKNNLMDAEVSFDSSNAFKNSSSDSLNTSYSKQLTLLSEMGFTDTEFNYKTLKAANGNLQEALEIIVAANNKQRRKTAEKNIFDEIEEVKPASSVQHIPKEQNTTLQSTVSIQTEEWGFESASLSSKLESYENPSARKNSDFPDIDAPVPVPVPVSNVQNKQSNSSNPWDDDFVEEDSSSEKKSKNGADPFDTYKAFKSTTDNYFDNPW